jgi:hypothetical protein
LVAGLSAASGLWVAFDMPARPREKAPSAIGSDEPAKA